MTTPIGSRIQNLEKAIMANLKETELVEHPHFYHRNLRDLKEPITLCYKVVDVYRQESDSYDPLFEILQLNQALETAPGVLELKRRYDEQTGVHTIQVRLDESTVQDALNFKYDLLLAVNHLVGEYLIEIGKKPNEREIGSNNHKLAKKKKRKKR